MPMAPLGLRDRDAGTVTVTSSLGLPKKLERIRRNPSVALAYHAREHGDSDSPLYVLVQGTATMDEGPNRAWLESITPQWEHFLGPRHGGPLGRFMDIYYWQRIAITVQVRRITVYDGTSAPPRVLGEDLPTAPPAQRAPKQGTAPPGGHGQDRDPGPEAPPHVAGMGSGPTGCPWWPASVPRTPPNVASAWCPATHPCPRAAAGRVSPHTHSKSTWSVRNNVCTPAGSRLTGPRRCTPHTPRPATRSPGPRHS